MVSLVLAFSLSLIVLLAYFLRRITGFGAAIAATPFAALLFGDVKQAVAVVAVIELASTLGGFSSSRGRVWGLLRAPGLLPVTLGTLVGCGALFLSPATPLKVAFSVYVMLFALKLFFGPHFQLGGIRMPSAAYFLAGGLFGGFLNTGRPFVTHALQEKYVGQEFGSKLSSVFASKGIVQVACYIALGIASVESLTYSLSAVPALVLASLLARATPTDLDEKIVTGAASLILFVAGGLVLIQ